MLAERVDLEMEDGAVGRGDRLRLEVDGHPGVGALFGVLHQGVHLLLREHDGQDAVLEAVVEEDVGVGRRDHAADAEVEKRPGRVLAARPAAEVLARDEDLRLAVGRAVQHEVGDLVPVGVEAHLVEEVRAEAGRA